MGRLLKFPLDFLEHATTSIGVAFMVGMSGIMFFQVVLRYIFDFPIPWGEEVLKILMAWSVLLLIGAVVRRNEHIRVTFFAEKLFGPSRALRIYTVLENVFGVGTMGFFSWVGWKYFMWAYSKGFRTTGTSLPWDYPYWVIQIAFFIGMAIAGLFYVERLVKQILSGRADRARTSAAAGPPPQSVAPTVPL